MPYVLTIREFRNSWAGRGPLTTLHETEDEAKASLVEYVKENWKAQIEDEPPEDPDDMIREYFDFVLEEYEISEVSG